MPEMEIPKINKRFEVFNKAENQEEAVMYMYGSIGKGWFSDISAKDVRYKLNNLTAKTINIHVNSPGGDVFESIAIHNLLKNHKATINIHIDGLAASGASVIAMAGDKIIMPKNTMMMIHKAWTWASGNAEGLRKIANDLEKIDSAVTESYTSRFVGERTELETLLAEETWLTAAECKTFGFCNEIVDEIEIPDDEEEEQEEDISAKEKILNKYSQQFAAQSNNEPPSASEESHQQQQPEENKASDNANVLYQFLNSFNTTRSE
jgi:ATP-dependent Clp protease, protease subunit